MFVRPASGLVREISTTKALFFNWGAATGGGLLLGLVHPGLFGGAPILGLAPYNFGEVVGGLLCIPVAFQYVILLMAMPRSGGDYVFTSRIVHPFLGWIETWTLLWANLVTFGWEIFVIQRGFRAIFTVQGFIFPGSGWTIAADALRTPLIQLAFGVGLCILVAAIVSLRSRTFYTLVSVLCSVAIVGGVGGLLEVLTMDPSVFSGNLNRYLGQTSDGVISLALKNGMSTAPITFLALLPIINVAFWALLGFQFTGYLGGELKGNLKRNTLFSMLGVLAINTIFCQIMYPLAGFWKLGYTFVTAWGYLFYNTNASPSGVLPTVMVFALLGRPDLWVLWVVLTAFVLALTFCLLITYLVMLSRVILAWSMDRVVPEWFSKVDNRTHQPTRAYILMLILALIFYSGTAVVPTFSPTGLIWYSSLLCMFAWIMPGFDVLLLPYRRKDLYESVPWRRKIGSVPIVSLLGLLWLIIIIPVYVTSTFAPLLSSVVALTPTGGFWAYATKSGLDLVSYIVLAGIILYLISFWNNKRQGIDVSLIFKSVPPE